MVSLLPGSRLGRYEIVEELGRGGMATVFKAHDPTLNRDVAVKVLPATFADDPTFPDRFAQEAQAIARLNHPNILQIYDFGEDRGFTYIVVEYVPSGSLQDRLDGPFPLGEAIRVLQPLAEALDYAHSQGIIHRDIKPANVLIDADSRPVLADFGLSRVMEQISRMTAPQTALGTPEYMSPEQALGRDADHRSDLYSFGILAYQMLVGQTPFHANTPAATLMAHVHQPLPMPDTPGSLTIPAVSAVLVKATAKSPDERYSTAVEMVESLAQAAGLSGRISILTDAADTVVLPTSPVTEQIATDADSVVSAPVPTTTSTFRRRLLIAGTGAAFVGAVVAAVVGFALLGGNGEPEETASPSTPVPAPTSAPQPALVTVQATSTPEPAEPAPTPFSVAEFQTQLAETQSRIQSGVSFIRVLIPEEKIETEIRSRSELLDFGNAYFRRRFLRDQVFETEELYKTLGLLDEDDDLEKIIKDIFFQQTIALFDDESESVYIFSDASTIGTFEELGYAGTVMGGLQQQHFDISEKRRKVREGGNFDEDRALKAFIEGDVFVVLESYVNIFFSEEQAAELREPLPDNLLKVAPTVVRNAGLFPQKEGFNFVVTFLQSPGGWDAVNSIYSRLPVSTEQIIHPEKYALGETPVTPELPDLVDAPGKGWNLISMNTMGEFLLRTYLEEHLESATASIAAEGWGGDRYVLLTGPEAERMLVLQINWDTPEDGDEFIEAYQAFAESKTQGQATTLSDSPSRQWWITSDQTVFLGSASSSTLLIIADDQSIVQRILPLLPGF